MALHHPNQLLCKATKLFRLERHQCRTKLSRLPAICEFLLWAARDKELILEGLALPNKMAAFILGLRWSLADFAKCTLTGLLMFLTWLIIIFKV